MFRAQGHFVEMVIVADDVALADSTNHAGRRGLAGTILVHKIAGAAAEAGASVSEVAAEARAAASAVRTMGVALTPCIVPAAGQPGFTLGHDEIELGLGIHGEPGVRREALQSADRLVDELLEPILKDLQLTVGERVVLLVNNLGATPTMELAIVARRALTVIEQRGILVERAYAGTFLSALEMAGVSLSVMRVDDERLRRLDAPTGAPAWPNAAAQPRSRQRSKPHLDQSTPDLRKTAGKPVTHAGQVLEQVLSDVCEALIHQAPQFTEMDREVGDGDLGISLARGAQAMRDQLPMIDLDDPTRTLYDLGMTVQRVMGGTSGALYSVFLLRASRLLHQEEQPGLAAWARVFRGASEAIREFGGAEPGDRTMLDALLPAVAAVEAGAARGLTAAETLDRAATEASAGAEATKTMSPRRGRSSYVGERVLGFPDPGAAAVAAWLRVVATAFRE
jgi:dihydroxyacetone kinase